MAVRASEDGPRRGVRWRRWLVAGAVVGLAGSGALAPVAAGAADPSADLSVGVSHAPSTATAPVDITFTVTASNAGPDTAEDVVVGLGFQYPLEPRDLPDGCRPSPSYESVVCDVGDVASGGSASVDIPLYARGSGLFTLPAAVGSPTADPVAANNSATDSLLVSAGPSQAVRYVEGVFPVVLNRDPGTAETTYWAARWKKANNSYPRVLRSVPVAWINSNEYRRIRVREAYQNTLGRAADPGGLDANVRRAAAGWTYQQIERALITSPEFFRRAGVTPWTNDPRFIDAVVQAVVGRPATTAEIKAYTPMVGDARQPTLQRFVQYVQSTTEARTRIINEKYQDTLGAPATPLARYVWLLRFNEGRTPESLWADLLVSYDVLQKYPYTIDDYTDGFEYAVPVSDVVAAVEAA